MYGGSELRMLCTAWFGLDVIATLPDGGVKDDEGRLVAGNVDGILPDERGMVPDATLSRFVCEDVFCTLFCTLPRGPILLLLLARKGEEDGAFVADNIRTSSASSLGAERTVDEDVDIEVFSLFFF